MNRLNEKQNEKGSVLVEVIAVIALLGVMGPLLFRQVMTRNEEVENINIASEMRTLKEAFSAYILTNKTQLLKMWNGGAEEPDCKSISASAIDLFLPYGNDAYKDYDYHLCKNSDDFLQGYIVPIPGDSGPMPENVGLKRAARIANLIGADAAICQDGNINGVAGGWGESDSYGWCDTEDENDDSTIYLVTTGRDTYMPEVTYEDYSTGVINLPNNLALENLHAWNYFSAGNGEHCYTVNHNKTGSYDSQNGFTANDDTINDAGTECDPLFWVGTKSSGTDDKAKGDVYVKNNLKVGAWRTAEGTQKQAIGLFRADPTEADASAGNKIVVYDNAGNDKVIINGKGEIIAKGETDGDSETEETMTMTNQGLESSLMASNARETYKIDPAYTSVMNDIKLDSRGGARLSDILPNYISRGIYEIKDGTAEIPVPGCPTDYAAAVIVTPTMWKNKPTVSKDEISTKLKTKEFEIPAEGETVAPVEIEAENDLEVQNADLRITIGTEEKGYVSNPNPGSTWVIKFLSGSATEPATGAEPLRTDVQGLAQTFCVYDTEYNGSWSKNRGIQNR